MVIEKLKFVVGFFLFAPAFVTAQNSEIHWSDRALKWEMYKSSEVASGNQVAFSYVGINYSMAIFNNRPSVSYEAYFLKDASWVMAGSSSNALLTHEQRMFDLAELYARKMRKQSSLFIQQNYGNLNSTMVLDEARKTYRKLMNEYLEKVQLYNSETNNGKDSKAQQRWNKYIDGELKKLAVFALLSSE